MAGICGEHNVGGMQNTLLKQTTTNLRIVAIVSLLAGCATTSSPQAENALLSAGFKAKAAITAKQREELQTLPEGKVSLVRQNGKTFYVYPDAPHNQIYVANKAQGQAYKRLIAQQPNSAGPIVFQDDLKGTDVTVKEFYGWAPFREF
jgi:hypothetical protein